MERFFPYLAIIGLVAGGVYGTWFWVARDRGPPLASFESAAKVIKEGWKDSDVLFLEPPYATRAKEFLGDHDPLAVHDPLAEDLDVHPRAWVFGLFDAGVKLRARMTEAGMKLVRSEEAAPGITVDLYETGTTLETTYAFLENLKKARVVHEDNGTQTRCASWSDQNGQLGKFGGRWTCPQNGDWFYVSPEYHRMDDVVRLCFWAHPPASGRLSISFPEVPMTGSIAGHAGHTLNGTLHARAPINFDVAIGNMPPQRYELELTDRWMPFAIATPLAGTATVTFSVSTSDNGSNHFCFAAEGRAHRRN